MFDKFRLKEVLVEYKKRFVQQQWPNEKYKWEAVQCFQLNWDVNSDDFAQMLTKSLAQTANLLTCLTLINTCWNWKRMRRSNRIGPLFQCWIFRYDKVECMETWLSVRTKNSC